MWNWVAADCWTLRSTIVCSLLALQKLFRFRLHLFGFTVSLIDDIKYKISMILYASYISYGLIDIFFWHTGGKLQLIVIPPSQDDDSDCWRRIRDFHPSLNLDQKLTFIQTNRQNLWHLQNIPKTSCKKCSIIFPTVFALIKYQVRSCDFQVNLYGYLAF